MSSRSRHFLAGTFRPAVSTAACLLLRDVLAVAPSRGPLAGREDLFSRQVMDKTRACVSGRLDPTRRVIEKIVLK